MSDAPVPRLRRIGRLLRNVLVVLLGLGAVVALGSWWLWPPQPYAVLPDSRSATRIVFSRDGSLIAGYVQPDAVLIWETATGKLHRTLPGDATIAALVFSPDGRLLASRGERLRVFEVATGNERPLALDNVGVVHVAFSPDSKTLLVAAPDAKVCMVDLTTGDQWAPSVAPDARRVRRDRQQWGAGTGALTAFFSADGRWLAWEDSGLMRVFDVATRAARAAYPGALGQLAFSPDGETWAIASGNEVRLCAAPSGEERAVLRGHSSPVVFLAWSPDGRRLASVAGDDWGEVKLWDAASRQEVAAFSPGQAAGVARFSPDGRFLCLIVGDLKGPQVPLQGRAEAIPLWDLSAQPPRRAVSVTAEEVVGQDDRTLACIGDPNTTVEPWTIAKRVRAASWAVGPSEDYPVFTPDGKMVILSGNTATVRGKVGKWLARGASDANGHQYKWVDVDSWRVRAVLDTDTQGVLSPDRSLLATGGSDRPVELWRVPPRRPLTPLILLIGLGGLAVAVPILRRRRRRGRVEGTSPAADPSPDTAPPAA
jgi:WD40 repeat protein